MGGPACLPAYHRRQWGPALEPQARGWASWTDGSEAPGATQGSAGRRQPSPAPGAQGVAQRRSTGEAGELASEDPVEGRALPTGRTSGGNQGEHFAAPVPVTATPLDSLRGARPASSGVVTAALQSCPLTNRMPESGTSGSVGAPGRKPWRDPARADFRPEQSVSAAKAGPSASPGTLHLRPALLLNSPVP